MIVSSCKLGKALTEQDLYDLLHCAYFEELSFPRPITFKNTSAIVNSSAIILSFSSTRRLTGTIRDHRVGSRRLLPLLLCKEKEGYQETGIEALRLTLLRTLRASQALRER